jgi:hypothetical protein
LLSAISINRWFGGSGANKVGEKPTAPFPSAFPAGAADGRFKGGFYDTQLSKRYGKNDCC